MNEETQKRLRDMLMNTLTPEQRENAMKAETQLEENIKQYEKVNNTTLNERERHIYSAAYWIGKMDGRIG
jgi:hypothetical protein